MNGKFLVALAVLILVSSGASYGQRRRGSTALKKVILPVGLTTIEKGAFAGAKIEELYFPSTVTMLGWLSFANCMNLKKITMPNRLKEDVNMLFSAFQCDTYYMFNMSPDPEKWTIFTWID